MEDNRIIDLYWERSEDAIDQTSRKYGNYCYSIAYGILRDSGDSEECVNDTYLRAWRAMPPERPERLPVFLGKITRNLSLDRYRRYSAQKRGSSQLTVALDELRDCVPAKDGVDSVIDDMALTQLLERFLSSLSAENRRIFMQRYWLVRTVREIADGLGVSQSKVKMSLLRSRDKLRELMEKEGVTL